MFRVDSNATSDLPQPGKTKTLNVQHIFWQISLPPRTTNDVKLDRNGHVFVAV